MPGSVLPMPQRDMDPVIEQMLAQLHPDDLKTLIGQLMENPREAEEVPVPSRRRPRREQAMTYRVRIDLADTEPPVWRRLELSSELFLDELHAAIQAAFGWTDSHLHQFGSGPTYYDRRTEYYLCAFQADEGEPGIPEEQVRLDEVLVNVGDILYYLYDFGDDWQHLIELEAVSPREPGAARAVCTDGRRPGPPEDFGGVGGYELIIAATDPAHPEHRRAVAEFRSMYGEDIDQNYYSPVPFDPDTINERLTAINLEIPADREPGPIDSTDADLPELMRDVVILQRTAPPPARNQLRQLIDRVQLGIPVHIDEEIASAAVRPYRCLIEHLGTSGIALTGAGYLPPAVVASIFRELNMDEDWIGKGNREDLTPPVAQLRASAQQMGLVRKYRGKLSATTKGRALRDDPIALWWHLAMKTGEQIGKYGDEPALLYLVAIAAGVTDGVDRMVADILTATGWRLADGTPLESVDITSAVGRLSDVFERMNLLRRNRTTFGRQFSSHAAEFARSILLR